MPTSYQYMVGGLEKERRTLVINYWSMLMQRQQTQPILMELPWGLLAAGGPSAAVKAVGTQLRDPINSGLARWRIMAVYK